MRRREVIAAIASAAVVPPLAARAQQPERLRLIGVLMGFAESDQFSQSLVAQLRDTLAKLGWKDGANLRIEVRWGAGDAGKIAALAKELVELRPDAILGQTTPVAKALARETRTIPIVFVTVSDPIGSGLAESLARPGGNVTGFTFVEHDTGGKWVELLKEIAPQTTRAALLFNPTTAPPLEFYLPSIKSAAPSFGIETFVAPVTDKDEIEGVISAQARDPGGSIIVMPDAFNTTNQHLIVALAARYRVPAIYGNNFADAGGLIYYGANFLESFRLAAGYVDRVLKGTKPEELPIQLPAKFELVINLNTAKALGLTVPQSLIVAADEVIE
jgi:putative tryptophan/tyrosine transport system substrate-binding protein